MAEIQVTKPEPVEAIGTPTREAPQQQNGATEPEDNNVYSKSGQLSMEDAYKLLTNVGYGGEQNFHNIDTVIDPQPGQCYLFYYPIEKSPFNRFKLNDGYLWHNKNKMTWPKEPEEPKLVRTYYKATAKKSQDDIMMYVGARKVFWLAAAETAEESPVMLVEYIATTDSPMPSASPKPTKSKRKTPVANSQISESEGAAATTKRSRVSNKKPAMSDMARKVDSALLEVQNALRNLESVQSTLEELRKNL